MEPLLSDDPLSLTSGSDLGDGEGTESLNSDDLGDGEGTEGLNSDDLASGDFETFRSPKSSARTHLGTFRAEHDPLPCEELQLVRQTTYELNCY